MFFRSFWGPGPFWPHDFGGRRQPPGRPPGGFPPRPPGGPPWGGGGPFGPWMAFRRRGRARRGDVRAGILALLAEQPRNGYQIMQELEQRSRGMWRPSPGSVYPALEQLEDEGLVRAETTAAGRAYHLTERGRAYVAEQADDLKAPWEQVAGDEGDQWAETIGLIKHIAAATTQVVTTGTPAQIAEARKLLRETRRGLYGILAEDDSEGADAPGDESEEDDEGDDQP